MKPLLAILLLALPLRSATVNATTASKADVDIAYAACVDGDTLAIPAGTGSWHTTLAIDKAITVQGAGIGSTIIIDDNMSSGSSTQQIMRWTTEAGKSYRMTGIEFRRALRDVTGSAATNVITCTGHELAVNDGIYFVSSATRDPDDIPLVGGAGITAGAAYYVLTTPTVNTFTIAATVGGAEIDFTTDITAGQWWRKKTGYPYDQGSFTVGGPSSSVRIDHCRFYNLQNTNIKWTSPYGVIDHCNFVMNALTTARTLLFASHSHNGVSDSWGDIDWETPINWTGDRKAVYMEDCTFDRFGTSSASIYGITDAPTGGGRLVFRYNTLVKSTSVTNHGTETGTRYRGGRMMEVYGNIFNNAYDIPSTVTYSVHARSGTVIAWNNRFTGLYSSNFKMNSYRRTQILSPWGIADGTKAWDSPDLTDGAGTPGGAGDGVFDSGTLSAAGSNSATDSTKSWTTNAWNGFSLRTNYPFTATSGTANLVTVSGATWTANEWLGYEITRVSDNAKGVVASNTATGITFHTSFYKPTMTAGGEAFVLSMSGQIAANTATALTTSSGAGSESPRVFRTGASYEIRCVDKVLDDSGLGVTTPLIGSPANHQSLNQGMDPCYLWDNLKRSTDAGAWSDASTSSTISIKENRNWYKQTATFDGTVGVGSGTLAARPATCTTGVGYWATDQGEWNSTNGATPDGQLYVATATDTWGLHYVPYTYPHPLVLPEAPDVTAPTVFSATIENDGTTLTLVFTEDVVGVNSANYTVTSCTLGTAVGSGPTCTIPLSPTVLLGAAPTLGYTAGTTVDTATSPNSLANFSGAAITNNSIQTALSVPGRLRNLQILIQ